jgi:MoxR-like ATPase
MVGTGVNAVAEAARKINDQIERVIVGKRDVAELLLVAILCDGHVLIEDVPGIGKTMLARSMSRSLGCTFRRVQFTPDLLPSDITGTHVFDQKTGDFAFRQGPVFTQVLLADEINRATPRTQSALLEAMEEKQVTAEGESMALPRPFLVLATQNPIELEGTFPLPEAQLDRFLLRVRMGYPTQEEDALILDRFMKDNPVEDIEPVLSAEDLVTLQGLCRDVTVEADVREYISKLTHASRNHPQIELGASPRAMLGLLHASQALAAVRGRGYVIPDDVKTLVPAVFEHRISMHAQSNLRGDSLSDVLKEIVDSVAAPVETMSAATTASATAD